MEAMSCAAVITGDIVKSGSLSDADFSRVMQALAKAADAMTSWSDIGKVAFEQFRGDGWQLFMSQPKHALRAACLMRAAVRAVCESGETRLAIGIGRAERAPTLGASTGTAFERSGQALDALSTHRLFGYGGVLSTPTIDLLIDAVVVLCDERSQGWTARQAYFAAVLLAPDPPQMKTLAVTAAVQPQTVYSHFQRAGGHAMKDALARFEDACESLMPKTAQIG